MPENTKVIGVRLPIDQAREIEAHARRLDVKISVLMKRLVSAYLAEQRAKGGAR